MKQTSLFKRKEIPKNTAYRIRVAIASTGLKTPEFARITQIPRMTLWKLENNAPLTTKAAIRISEALKHFNVECSPHWLITGEGEYPQMNNLAPELFDKPLKIKDSALSTFREADIFRSLNSNHVVCGIRDNAMAPIYENGDYVGGIKIPAIKIKKAYNQNCIVTLKGGQILIRKFKAGDLKNKYKLYACNLESKAKDIVLLNVEIESVAVIVWHRRNFDI